MKNKFILALLLAPIFYSYGQNPNRRIEELGIVLPEVTKPIANYVKWKHVGNTLYLAGAGPDVYGKLGKDLTIDQGYQAARETGIEILAILKQATGDLNRVKQFVKVRGMVNCTDDFYDHPKVINGFSDLMVDVFGEKGKHARAAVGHNSLPNNIAVEIEVIVELE
ncbi:RidA family protein [Namhaeicola litoreus]|uniref:RidA family protein n=1 Tax=Namhaeicola litoreus TaxID=1052145 RepID=A0ABW3Y7A7_9FLAO